MTIQKSRGADLVFSLVLVIFSVSACAPAPRTATYTGQSSESVPDPGVGPSPVPTPSPGPVPLPTPTPSATFSQVQTIMSAKCVSCHGSGTAYAGVRLDSYNGVFARVIPGSSNTSRLYIVCSSGSMPPQPATRVSASDLTVIRAWIDAGALNN